MGLEQEKYRRDFQRECEFLIFNYLEKYTTDFIHSFDRKLRQMIICDSVICNSIYHIKSRSLP